MVDFKEFREVTKRDLNAGPAAVYLYAYDDGTARRTVADTENNKTYRHIYIGREKYIQ